LWFAVGLSAMQPIGQLAEVTSSVAAAAIFGLLAIKVSQWSAKRRYRPMASAQRVPPGMPIAGPPSFRRYRPPDRPERRLP
jgi:hypothetical protein